MTFLLRFLDSGAYHARKWDDIAPTHYDILESAICKGYSVRGRFGYTLTVRGFYAAYPTFTSGDGSC